MKAIRVHQTGGPEAMQLDEVADPTPSGNEALIEIAAIGVNYIDVYFRTGLYPAPLPLTLGLEASGTVRAVGPGVATDASAGVHMSATTAPPSSPRGRPERSIQVSSATLFSTAWIPRTSRSSGGRRRAKASSVSSWSASTQP